MAQRVVRVTPAWRRQTPKVSFPVTIIKPNGERFVVAPSKAKSKRKHKARVSGKVVKPRKVSAQDTRAIELAERQRLFAESQKRLELEMRGAYN
jgi:DMSO/TMAO reductase YedYZ molybdopterin-dependent catalytic subunit